MKKNNRKIKHTVNTRSLSVSPAAIMRYLRLFFVISLSVASLGMGVYYINHIAQSVVQQPIASVSLEADFRYITKPAIESLLDEVVGKSFVGQDLNGIQDKLQSHPWIDQVTLSRQWPDRLVITAIEQVPIARWGDKGFVNNRGEVIETSLLDGLTHLAELEGQQKDAAAMMQQYSLVATQLRSYGLVVAKLKKDIRGTWSLALDNGWEVILGKNEMLRRVSRLTALLQQQNISTQADIERIDARYENGFAIRWVNDEDEAVKAKKATGVRG